ARREPSARSVMPSGGGDGRRGEAGKPGRSSQRLHRQPDDRGGNAQQGPPPGRPGAWQGPRAQHDRGRREYRDPPPYRGADEPHRSPSLTTSKEPPPLSRIPYPDPETLSEQKRAILSGPGPVLNISRMIMH